MNHVRENSELGGRRNIYRNIKSDLATESYVTNEWSVGVRRVLAGPGRAACHWAWRLAGTQGLRTAHGRVACVLWGGGGPTPFLIICPAFTDLRLQLFNYCYSLSHTFFELPVAGNTHFILNNSLIVNSLYKMYTQRQLLLFSH